MKNHTNKKIAILATNGFERVELTEPKIALEESGVTTYIISDHKKIVSWHERQWWDEFNADILLDKAKGGDYDMLLLPGGVINPDRLRRNRQAVEFIAQFEEQNKPVAAICHGPQMLIEAGLVNGKTMTSFISIKTDLINAGADWIDEEVVEDGYLITSRNPGDIPAFNKKILEKLTRL